MKSFDLIPILAAVLVFMLKLQHRSHLLSWWDSAQFALAIERYNILEHRPHPPGYPLYILTGKILTCLTHNPNLSFVLIGLLLSTIAAVLILKLVREMSGSSSVAWLAAGLYAFAPLTIYQELKALTYTSGAFFSILVAFLAWRIISGKEKNAWKIAIALGLMGMVRPYESILLVPLAIWAVYRLGYKKLLMASGIYLILQAAWLIPVALLSGGFTAYLAELASEGGKHQRNISALLHKPLGKLVKNWRAIYFYLRQSFPGWAFFAIIPLFSWRKKKSNELPTSPFFLLWGAPAIILYSINYVNYPGIPLFISPLIAIVTAFGINKVAGWFTSLRIKIGHAALNRNDIIKLLAVIIPLHLLIVFFSLDILVLGETYRKYDPDGYNYHRLYASDAYVMLMINSLDTLSDDVGGPDNILIMSDLNYRVLMYYLPHYNILWTRYLSQRPIAANGETMLAFGWNDMRMKLPSVTIDDKKYWVFKLKDDEKVAVFTSEMLINIADNSRISIIPGMDIEGIEAVRSYMLDLKNAWGIYFTYGEFGVLSNEMAQQLELASDYGNNDDG